MMKISGPKRWLCVLLLRLLPDVARGCPAPCRCSVENRTAECGDRQLQAAPRGFPPGTRSLDLSRNLIRAVGRADWSRPPGWARRLEDLDLAHNLLAQLEPGAFVGLDRLRALNLTGNRLRYLEPGSLRGLPSLHSLDLTLNPLVALLDHGLAGPSSLRLLALGAPTLVHVGPEAFSGLGQLAQLTVAGSAMEQAPALGPLANLTVLRLQGVGRPRTLPPGWLEGLGRLRALELDGWRSLREVGPGALRGVSLVWLSVTHGNLTEVPYAGLRLQAQLRYLNLSYNPIGLLRRGQLHHLARLQELRLRGAALLEVELWAFRGLPAFRLLDLTSNRLQSLEQRAFHAVGGLQSLGLGLNPLACDCRLLWAVRRRRRLRFLRPGPVCASPPAVRGLSWAGEGGDDGPLPAEAFRCRVPVIRGKTPPQRLRAREGQTAALRCSADGIPPPSIVWLNPRRLVLVPGRGPLAGPAAGRSSLLPDGTLLIAGVRPTDAGNYRCVARNAGGNDSAWASLLVRPLSARELSLRPRPSPGPVPGLGLDSATLDPLLGHALGRRAVLVATSLGLCSFLGTVSVCFSLLLAWSRLCGPIKHSTHIEFVPHDGGDGGGGGADGKFNMKMV